jgi:uncharacterized protein YecE (DUF72 family)
MFCDRAAELEEKLGPLLVQLPPDMTVRESPESARRLQTLVGVEPADPGVLHEQQDLFGG